MSSDHTNINQDAGSIPNHNFSVPQVDTVKPTQVDHQDLNTTDNLAKSFSQYPQKENEDLSKMKNLATDNSESTHKAPQEQNSNIMFVPNVLQTPQQDIPPSIQILPPQEMEHRRKQPVRDSAKRKCLIFQNSQAKEFLKRKSPPKKKQVLPKRKHNTVTLKN